LAAKRSPASPWFSPSTIPTFEKETRLKDDEIIPIALFTLYHVMEALIALGLVGNIVQFVDFGREAHLQVSAELKGWTGDRLLYGLGMRLACV
jgi:hypothetical protein